MAIDKLRNSYSNRYWRRSNCPGGIILGYPAGEIIPDKLYTTSTGPKTLTLTQCYSLVVQTRFVVMLISV